MISLLSLHVLADQLRERFDALLVAEVQQYGGIPDMPVEEVAMRDAVAELLEHVDQLLTQRVAASSSISPRRLKILVAIAGSPVLITRKADLDALVDLVDGLLPEGAP